MNKCKTCQRLAKENEDMAKMCESWIKHFKQDKSFESRIKKWKFWIKQSKIWAKEYRNKCRCLKW